MSENRNLPTEIKNENSVQLHSNGLKAGSLIDQSLSRLNQDQAQNLMAKAGEEALKLEVKSRTQNLDYVVGKKAIEDHIETFDMLDKTGRTTRQSVVSEVTTGAGKMRIESKSGATCFVASVAYGDPEHSDVVYLRKYRDKTLINNYLGRKFIDWYWQTGPKIALFVQDKKHLKSFSKFSIQCIVRTLKLIEKAR